MLMKFISLIVGVALTSAQSYLPYCGSQWENCDGDNQCQNSAESMALCWTQSNGAICSLAKNTTTTNQVVFENCYGSCIQQAQSLNPAINNNDNFSNFKNCVQNLFPSQFCANQSLACVSNNTCDMALNVVYPCLNNTGFFTLNIDGPSQFYNLASQCINPFVQNNYTQNNTQWGSLVTCVTSLNPSPSPTPDSNSTSSSGSSGITPSSNSSQSSVSPTSSQNSNIMKIALIYIAFLLLNLI